MASCRPGLLDWARAISCGGVSFWALSAGSVVRRRRIANLFIDCPIYSTAVAGEKTTAGVEKQIPFGNDRQKGKGKNMAESCGIPPLPQRTRQGWGTQSC